MELNLSPDCLAVFIDDTGHETFPNGHTVFGLGGCAVMAGDLDRLIRNPWREVRTAIAGSSETPLHAASFARVPSAEQIEAISRFFRENHFARIGATVSVQTSRSEIVAPFDIVAGVLKNRIADVARWTPFRQITVIFEASQRTDRLINQSFDDFRIEEDGNPIPVDCYFMPKSVHEPALEVADFVMHAVGRQVRRRVEGREGFGPDFKAVFHTVSKKHASFMDVTAAVESAA